MSQNPGDSSFETLLEFLFQTHGFDFTGYKRVSLQRRVRHRMDELRLPGFDDYLDYLQVHPDEFAVLFDTILINVTAFFRDPAAWEFLRERVLPEITADRSSVVRAWSAGCASGEEAYSLAISLAECVGLEEFQQRVKIYATDVDADALQRARSGSYTSKEVSAIDPALREKYFEMQGNRAVFRPELRRSLIFGRHDLVQDAPISRLDLIVSRNTLMYFTADAQRRILVRLHYGLKDSGYLFLGRAEMLLTHPNLFTPVDIRHRIFTQVPPQTFDDQLQALPELRRHAVPGTTRDGRLRDLALDANPTAQITVDTNNAVVFVSEAARAMFGLTHVSAGKPFSELEVFYRPIELRAHLEEARHTRQPVTLNGVEYRVGESPTRYFDVVVTPLYADGSAHLGATVAFVDVSAVHSLRNDLQRSKQELETAYEELQSTNEELETTNEELQSTVEELETTNEELQSANEELETMNEELQSTNSELQAVNIELRDRSDDLDNVNNFMEAVLTSLRDAVVVVDVDLRTRVWSSRAEDLWGLRAQEVMKQPFMSLDIGLPVEELDEPLRRCLAGETDHEELTVRAMTRRGRTIDCRVIGSVLFGSRRSRDGVVILMEERQAPASG